MQRRLSLVAGLLAALTESEARSDPAVDDAAIRKRLVDWSVAFNNRDAKAACDLFAPDLAYSVPGIENGTYAAMCGNFVRLFAKPGLRLRYDEPDIHEVIVAGDWAIVRLTWTLETSADGTTTRDVEHGIDIFRRQGDARWAIARFIAIDGSRGK